jgi:hypothetical protein
VVPCLLQGQRRQLGPHTFITALYELCDQLQSFTSTDYNHVNFAGYVILPILHQLLSERSRSISPESEITRIICTNFVMLLARRFTNFLTGTQTMKQKLVALYLQFGFDHLRELRTWALVVAALSVDWDTRAVFVSALKAASWDQTVKNIQKGPWLTDIVKQSVWDDLKCETDSSVLRM